MTRFLDCWNIRIEGELGRNGQAHQVIELHGQIGSLQLRRQQVLFGLEQLGWLSINC